MAGKCGPNAMKALNCVALASEDVSSTTSNKPAVGANVENNYFKGAQWTPDGTSIITTTASNDIQTFIIPPSLLDTSKQPHRLIPYSNIPSSEPVKALSHYPGFVLSDPSTTLILSSVRDHPIRLNSALDGTKVASYPLVKPTTEAFVSPVSLTFTYDGTHFVAGSENLISVFDTSRIGSGPVTSLPTASKRNTSQAMGMKGIISTLAIEPRTSILAAGTYSRHVGLYASSGQGECIGIFCVDGTHADAAIRGAGITQVAWSPCGRYSYIAERKSDGVMIYDIRKTGQLLGWLEGRNAKTNQRLMFDMAGHRSGDEEFHDVWAGGVDGMIRRWEKPHEGEGAVQAVGEWIGHGDAVSSVTVHPGEGVIASCSGQRHFDEGFSENTLKIWSWDKEG